MSLVCLSLEAAGKDEQTHCSPDFQTRAAMVFVAYFGHGIVSTRDILTFIYSQAYLFPDLLVVYTTTTGRRIEEVSAASTEAPITSMEADGELREAVEDSTEAVVALHASVGVTLHGCYGRDREKLYGNVFRRSFL